MKKSAIITFFALVIIVVGGVSAVLYHSNIQPTQAAARKISQHKPLNVLVIGTTHKGSQTTSMTLASMNPGKRETLLTTIPQNEQTIINGYRSNNPVKISVAFNSGGALTATQTVRELLKVPVDNYIVVDAATAERVDKTGSLKQIDHAIQSNLSTKNFHKVTGGYVGRTKVITTQQLQGTIQSGMLQTSPREMGAAKKAVTHVIG